jgi:hypothetical protein
VSKGDPFANTRSRDVPWLSLRPSRPTDTPTPHTPQRPWVPRRPPRTLRTRRRECQPVLSGPESCRLRVVIEGGTRASAATLICADFSMQKGGPSSPRSGRATTSRSPCFSGINRKISSLVLPHWYQAVGSIGGHRLTPTKMPSKPLTLKPRTEAGHRGSAETWCRKWPFVSAPPGSTSISSPLVEFVKARSSVLCSCHSAT